MSTPYILAGAGAGVALLAGGALGLVWRRRRQKAQQALRVPLNGDMRWFI